MIELLNLAHRMEQHDPKLARVLRTIMRGCRAAEAAADEARAASVPAARLASLAAEDKPGLKQMRLAWRSCVPGATPPDWWCEHAAWVISEATEGGTALTAAQVRNYLVGVRDAGQAAADAMVAAKAVLYPERQVDEDGAPVDPIVTPEQAASIVAALDALVVAARGE